MDYMTEKLITDLLRFTEPDGTVVNGYRTKEIITELRAILAKEQEHREWVSKTLTIMDDFQWVNPIEPNGDLKVLQFKCE